MKVAGIIIGGLLLALVACGVIATIVGGTDVSTCHYDATLNRSYITEGNVSLDGNVQSYSRMEFGNVCN